jgi:hypothetical protein
MRHPILGEPDSWKPAQRWWSGNQPEWDIVAEDIRGSRLLLGEAKLASRDLPSVMGEVARRAPPDLPSRFGRHRIVRALFVPEAPATRQAGDVALVTLRHLLPGRPALTRRRR